jgi:hypothetical protein
MNVAAAYFDGLRELWYIFESSGSTAFTSPGDIVTLHVRDLDTTTGAWTEHQALAIPPMVASQLIAVLRDRIVYVAYTGADAAAGTSLVALDTSQPSSVTVDVPVPLAAQPFGLIGTRSNTQAGGFVNLLQKGSCGGGGTDAGASDAGASEGGAEGGTPDAAPPPPSNCLQLVHVTVTPLAAPNVAPPTVLHPFFGTAGYGSYLAGGPLDVIAAADTAGASSYNLTQYSPINQTPSGSPITVGSNDQFIKPIAFAECQAQALLVGTNQDLDVIARPMGAGINFQASRPTGHSGQGVYFEPTTSTVLTPFSQGNGFELTAFTLGGTQAAPTLTPRTSGWSPPPDLRPEIVATRVKLPIACQ